VKRFLRLAALCLSVVMVPACATTIGGFAEVGPESAKAPSVSTASSPGTEVSSSPASTESPTSSAEQTATSPSNPGTQAADTESSAAQSSVTRTTTTSSAGATTSQSLPSAKIRTTPTTPANRSRPTQLHCAAGASTAKNAPFCYPIPSGFRNVSAQASYPGTDPVKTALAPEVAGETTTRDLIFVTSMDLPTNSDNLSDAVIKAALQRSLKGGVTGTTSVSALKQRSVAGRRGFEFDIKFPGGIQRRLLLIFSGQHRVSVSCQWRDHQPAILAGCGAVLRTIQIANP